MQGTTERAAALADMERRLDGMDRALAAALDANAAPGTVYDALLEAAAALRGFRLTAAAMQEIAAEFARAAPPGCPAAASCPVLRLAYRAPAQAASR